MSHLPDDPLLGSIVDRLRQPSSGGSSDDGTRLRSLLVGSPPAVWGRIIALHRANITQVGNWSALIGIPSSDEVISIHIERGQPLADILDRARR